MRAAEALGKFLAHMHCPRPHLLLEEFPGFQLKTVISVNPCLWCLNICNTSHCSGFSSIQVHGVTCHSPSRHVPGFLQQILLTSPSSPVYTSRLSRRARRRKTWSPQKSAENFSPAFAESMLCPPCWPCQCLGSVPAQPSIRTLGCACCELQPCEVMLPWPDRGVNLTQCLCPAGSGPGSALGSAPGSTELHGCRSRRGLCGGAERPLLNTCLWVWERWNLQLCLDCLVLYKLWESLEFPVKEKKSMVINKI